MATRRCEVIQWLYDHYVLSGMIALYYMILLGYGTVQVFGELASVTGPVATVYVALLGLPPAGVGLMMRRLGHDDEG